MKQSAASIAIILFTASTPAVSQDQGAVDKIVGEFVKPGSPGCSVAVSKEGRTLVSRGYGLADLEHNIPVTPASRFQIASVSKQFTAAAVLLLAQDGKLSLEDDVRKYITELPDYGTKISIDHLLSHTSGLRDYNLIRLLQGWFPWDRRQFTQAESVDIITRQRHLNFPPGERWMYSNSNYVLAADIVRRVSGLSLREFLQKRLFEPLGMRSTELRDDYRQLMPGRAIGYDKQGERWVLGDVKSVHGAGNIISTPEDLLIWNEALHTGRLGSFVTAELHREAKTKDGRPVGYARGIGVAKYKGVEQFNHSGGSGGFSSNLMRFPGQRLSVAVTCNAYLPSVPISLRIADLFLTGASEEAGPKQPAKPVEVTAEHLAKFAGTFLDDAYGTLTKVDVIDGKLRFEGAPMVASSPNRFHGASGGTIVFKTPDLIEVRRPDGGLRTLRRADGPHPTEAQLAALSGRYRSDEAATTYEAVIEDKKLVLRIVDGPEFDFALTPIRADLFEDHGDIVRFVRDRRGKVTAFTITNSRLLGLRFDRIGDP